MKNFVANNWFKILAGIMLVVALGNHPYGYYQLLRWVIMAIAIYSAYKAHELGNNGWTWVFGMIAVLFNPIIPFYIERNTWQLIDLITAVIFFASFFQKKSNENKPQI